VKHFLHRLAGSTACVAVTLAALPLACGPADTLLAPRERLVDRVHATQPGRPAPTATILDERRLVLRAHPRGVVVRGARPIVTLDARVALRARLPSGLRGAERIVLAPRVRLRDGWTPLPAHEVGIDANPTAPSVSIEVELPRASIGSTVTLVVDGIVPPAGPRTSTATAPIPIPPGSRLEFGIGILRPAWEQGPVLFSIEGCEGESCQALFGETLDPGAPEGRGWQDRAIGLDTLAGRTVSFRFETERMDGGEASFTLPAWSSPTLYTSRTRSPDDFNLVLVSLDTLRADRLPPYGYPLDTAPFVAELAEEGTVFDAFVAAATTTSHSHMTLFTSIQPSVQRELGGFGRVWPRATTLAEALRSSGFDTGAITENVVLRAQRGFGRGFDDYLENKSAAVLEGGGDATATFEMAGEWIRRHADRRFFLFLHTYQVHHPYAPPEGYRDLFPAPAAGFEPDPMLPADRAPALYDREIRVLDDQIRRLFDTLEDEGLARDTLVVLTSDHGEEFLEHGATGHGPNVHAEVVNVPLILHGPGIPRDRRVTTPVGHVDLMPTLLELVGAPRPDSVTGRSFAGLLRPDAALPEPHPVYSEAWRRPSGRRGQPGLSVRLGSRKLVREPVGSGYRYRYFDVEGDPREQNDLYAQAAAEASDLRGLLDAYPERAASTASRLSRGKPPLAPADAGPELEPDPELEERLRALGYVD
jgi:arylsulfatase A-like enzyme